MGKVGRNKNGYKEKSMEIYIVSETHHMGMDGNYTSITLVTRNKQEALKEQKRIEDLPYEEYDWYSANLKTFLV